MTNSGKLRLSLSAALCLIAGCIPLPPPGGGGGGYPSEPQQSGWEQGPAPTSRERSRETDDNDYASTGGSGNSNWWLCTATGSLGTAYGDGPWDYSTELAHGNGPTRDDAYLQAVEDCNSMMSMSISLAISNGQKYDGGSCSVTDCIGPGR
jgi:hypothetical protein